MSIEKNKATIRKWWESASDFSVWDELVTENYVYHNPTVPNVRTHDQHKQFIAEFLRAFELVSSTIEDMVGEENKVVIRYTMALKHKGTFNGISPTGKQITSTGIGIFRLENGKLAEEWLMGDALGMMQQLGAIPSSNE